MTHQLKTIHLATDHAGYTQKEYIKTFLEEKGYSVIDHGAFELDPTDDYPVYIQPAIVQVSKAHNTNVVAIILGGSGQGEAIVASKYPHIRTTVCYGGDMAREIVKLGREHNDANVLSLGIRFIEEQDVLELVNIWLNTSFTKEERHVRRLAMIEKINK